MPKVHVVTDSSATFVSKSTINKYPITVIPNRVTVAGRDYRDGVDITGEDALRLINQYPDMHQVQSPGVEDFVAVYAALAKTCDAIISLHPSRELYPSWQHAKTAAQQIMGSCQVVVIDTQTLCVAQGMLVEIAGRATREETDIEAMIRAVRGAVERVYAVYTVDSLEFLFRNNILTPAHALLGTYLKMKPFLALEEGHLVAIEKVRNSHQKVDRLVEFAVEFVDLIDGAIVQARNQSNEYTRSLQERLSLEFPGHAFRHAVYNPALATLIGTDAFGVVVLEDETEGFMDDDFED